MNAPPRLVTALCLVQMVAVITGVFWTRWCLHLYELSPLYEFHHFSVPMRFAFVRSWGFWFLLVPVIWGAFAVLSADTRGGSADLTLQQQIIGAILTLAIGGFFWGTALQSTCFV